MCVPVGRFSFMLALAPLSLGSAAAVDEEKRVCVQAIYEPQQQGSADSLQLERHTPEEEKADFIAQRLG